MPTATIRARATAETAHPPLAGDEIRLQAGGAGWMGTFHLTAGFMVNNILDDGQPVAARLVLEDWGADTGYLLAVTGEVATWTGNTVTFVDGVELDLTDTELLSVTL